MTVLLLPDSQTRLNLHNSPRASAKGGRPPVRMLELQALIEAGYTDNSALATIMGITKQEVRVYRGRLRTWLDRNHNGHEMDPHSECGPSDHVTSNGEVICTRLNGEVVRQVTAQRKPDGETYTNWSQWGRGLGGRVEIVPGVIKRNTKKFGGADRRGISNQALKKLVEDESYDLKLLRTWICDAFDTPSSALGHYITNRTGQIAEKEYWKRRAQKIIDEHELYLVLIYSIRELKKSWSDVARFVNKDRLELIKSSITEGKHNETADEQQNAAGDSSPANEEHDKKQKDSITESTFDNEPDILEGEVR